MRADWLSTSSPWTLLVVLLGSALVSAVLAALVLPLRPTHLRGPGARDYLALLGMGLLVPVIGPLLMLFQLLLFNRFSRTHSTLEAQHLAISPFVPEEARPLEHFGIGGAVRGLQSGGLGTDKSIRALMAVEQQRSAQTSKVLFDTLGHADESVRLTAAGLLDRRESRVLQMIARVEKAIAATDASNATRLAFLHMEAAPLHAEMLYLRLAREGMAQLYLVRWGEHLDRAEAQFGSSPNWLISKARWLAQSDLPGSAALYGQAFDAGAAPSRVMPYLAEARWNARDYAGLRQLASSVDLFAQLPVSGVIKRRWGSAA